MEPECFYWSASNRPGHCKKHPIGLYRCIDGFDRERRMWLCKGCHEWMMEMVDQGYRRLCRKVKPTSEVQS